MHRIITEPGGPLYAGPSQVTTGLGLFLILLLIAIQILQEKGIVSLYVSGDRWPIWIRWPAYATLIFGISILGISNNAFIYFQF